MTQEPLTLERVCRWCGLDVAVTKHLATDTCKSCLAGGPAHRVRMSLQRWKRGVERR